MGHQVGQRQPHQSDVRGPVHVERLRPVRLELVVVLDIGERRVHQRDAGVVHHVVEPPRLRHRGVDQLPQLARVAHVAHSADRRIRTVDGADLVDHGCDPALTEVCNDHPGALVGEEMRRCAAHPTGRTRDDRGPSGDRSGQRSETRRTHADQRSRPCIPYWRRISARSGVIAMNAVPGESSGPPGANALRS